MGLFYETYTDSFDDKIFSFIRSSRGSREIDKYRLNEWENGGTKIDGIYKFEICRRCNENAAEMIIQLNRGSVKVGLEIILATLAVDMIEIQCNIYLLRSRWVAVGGMCVVKIKYSIVLQERIIQLMFPVIKTGQQIP